MININIEKVNRPSTNIIFEVHVIHFVIQRSNLLSHSISSEYFVLDEIQNSTKTYRTPVLLIYGLPGIIFNLNYVAH